MEPSGSTESPGEDLEDILDDALDDFQNLKIASSTTSSGPVASATAVLHKRVIIEEIKPEEGPSSSNSAGSASPGLAFDPLGRGKPEQRHTQSTAAVPPQRRPVFDPLARGTGGAPGSQAAARKGPRPTTSGGSGGPGGADPHAVQAAPGSAEGDAAVQAAECETGRGAGTGERGAGDQQAKKDTAPGRGMAFDPLRKRTGKPKGRSTGAGTASGSGARPPPVGLGPAVPADVAVPSDMPWASLDPASRDRLQELMRSLANQDTLGLGDQAGGVPRGPWGGIPSASAATLEALHQQSPQPSAESAPDADLDILRRLTQQLNELGAAFPEEAAGEARGGGASMGTGDWSGGAPDLTALAETFMMGLLSKDVLYQPMKDISERYPSWLDSNREVVEEAQFVVYQQQYDLASRIVAEFEKEEHRHDVILDLVQQMQATGAPPQEIMAEVTQGVMFDGDGLPSIPGLTSPGGSPDCCIQ